MAIFIHLAQQADKQELITFLYEIHGDEYKEMITQYVMAMFSDSFRRPIFCIAKEHDRIVAAASFSEEYFTIETWGIGWVSVDANHRNRGLGQKIVEACLFEISSRAKRNVTAILATYPEKTGLYDKIGFQKTGEHHLGGHYMTKIVEYKNDI